MCSLRKMTRLFAILAGAVLLTNVTAAEAITLIPIGSQPGSGAAYAFVGGSDGNVWLNTNSGGSWHWQNLAPLSVSFGVGVTAPGGSPAAYAVATNGDLYIIHQVGSSWSTQNIGTPSGVALKKAVGVMSNTSNQPFVFLVGSDGNLWLAHNAGSWTWQNLSRPSGVSLSTPVGAVNVPGSYPQIFVIGSDGNLWVAQWNGSSYPWTNVSSGHITNIEFPMFVWEYNNLPYAFVIDRTNQDRWEVYQEGSGGPWGWVNYGIQEDYQYPVGMPLNDETGSYVVNATCGGCGGWYLQVINWGTHSTQEIKLQGTSYVPTAPVGACDFGSGIYSFLINTSGHLEVIYGTSGNLRNAEAIDLGLPP